MNLAEVKQTLRGPMIPVVTNYRQDLSIDHDAIRENVSYVVNRGVVTGSGVLLAVGAGGDFPMLSIEERKAVTRTILKAGGDRVPVLVGAQDTNPAVIIDMARFAEDEGAYGIQFGPGYYYESSDDDCLRLFEAVHEATRRIAIMIYNTWWEGYNMSLAQVERLAELDRCRAIKWSTPDAASYVRGVARFAERLAVVDNMGLHVMNHLLGGTGYITHLCTVWPEHDLEVWRLLEAGDYRAAQQMLTAANWPWSDFRARMWKRTGAESPVIHAALELVGRPGGPSRLPTRPLNREERDELRGVLRQIGVPGVK
ncbi:MAG: dihydrodipicolinate synthase family protein [Planctomycetes bacterium]|nr:dihydrodipicolinate synthase family protein [Planctomycetota bacterium]